MLRMLHFIGSLGGRWRVKCTGTKHKEVAMLKNKLILAAAGLALSAPVFADHGHRDYRGHGHGYGHERRVVVHERHVVHHRPVYVRHYHRPAPRPVYVVQPAPVHRNPHPGAVLLVGAILGGAIVHSMVTGY
jgi:hypothetical protein